MRLILNVKKALDKHARYVLATLALFIAALSATSQAQTPTPTPAPTPSTDIFLLDLTLRREALPRIGQPVNITNREGYDNQPSFLPDGRGLLYTSIRENNQADIYRFDFAERSDRRLTETTESEFSPTVMPDGKFFSVVRVEADSTQRLWRFPLASGGATLVLEKVKPVGYHVWVDGRRVALFVLGKPNTLQLADLRTGEAVTLLDNVGRSMHRVPRQPKRISVVHKVSEQEWLIKSFDADKRTFATLVKTLPGSEDYAWTPDGMLLMAQDSKLFVWNPRAASSGWQEMADLSTFGIRGITRLAISPKGDKLALVAVQETKR